MKSVRAHAVRHIACYAGINYVVACRALLRCWRCRHYAHTPGRRGAMSPGRCRFAASSCRCRPPLARRRRIHYAIAAIRRPAVFTRPLTNNNIITIYITMLSAIFRRQYWS